MQHKLILPDSLFDNAKVYKEGEKVVIAGKNYEVKIVDKNRNGDTYELVEIVNKPAKSVRIAF